MTPIQRAALERYVRALYSDGQPTGYASVARRLADAGLDVPAAEIHRACSRVPFIPEPRPERNPR